MLHSNRNFFGVHQITKRSQFWASVHITQNLDRINIAELDCEHKRSVPTWIQLIL